MKRLVVLAAVCAAALASLAGFAFAQQPPPAPPQPVYIAQPQAYAAPARGRWEYKCIDENDEDRITNKANQLGADGWEMVGAGGTGRDVVWCFKRAR